MTTEMANIYIIVRKSAVNLSQDSQPVYSYSLQMLGDYCSKLTHPAFISHDKASEYLSRLPKTESFCLEV